MTTAEREKTRGRKRVTTAMLLLLLLLDCWGRGGQSSGPIVSPAGLATLPPVEVSQGYGPIHSPPAPTRQWVHSVPAMFESSPNHSIAASGESAPQAGPDSTRTTEPVTQRVAHAALASNIQTAIPDDEGAGPSRPEAANGMMLYELQLGRLARKVVQVYHRDGQLLVPVAGFLDLAELPHQADGPSMAARDEVAGERVLFDAGQHQIRRGNRSFSAQPGELQLIEGRQYASVGLLSRAFDLSAAPDPESATIYVYNPDALPVARRLEREANRAILIDGPRELPPDLVVAGRSGKWNGLALSYDLAASNQQTLSQSSYDIGLASGVAGGSVLLTLRGANEAAPQVNGSWTGVWPLSKSLTQLRVGDGVTSGPRPQESRGVMVTNAPFARPLLVEDLPFAGTLAPDWSIEAYRNGQLIGFDSVDASGHYLLTLPVQYGENPVDFKAYGPLGQVQTFNRTFRALPSMLPAGSFEYGVSAGQCQWTDCSGNGNVDLRYGLTRRVTVRGGVDATFGGGLGHGARPYASAAASPINALGLEAEAVSQGFTRGGVRVEPSQGLRLTADYIKYARDIGPTTFVPPGAVDQTLLSARVMPAPTQSALTFEGSASQLRTHDATNSAARVGASFMAFNSLLRPYGRVEHQDNNGVLSTTRQYLGVEATILPRRALGPVLGSIWVQGTFEAEDGRTPTSASVTLAKNLGHIFRVESGARWQRTAPGAVLTLSIVSQLSSVRATTLVTAPTSGEAARVDQSVGGSVIWNRDANMALSSEPALDRGGITGQAFLDLNGDGKRQLDEPAIAGVRVLVDNRWRTTDAEGRYQQWPLSVYQSVRVTVDSTSLSSPWWIPAFASAAVLPTPSSYTTVDLPIEIGGILDGSLVLDDQTSLPGRPIGLTLVNTATGQRTEMESFSDGSFYRTGIRPGHYQVVIDGNALDRLNLTADAADFTIERPTLPPEAGPAADAAAALQLTGRTVSGIRVVLHRRNATIVRRNGASQPVAGEGCPGCAASGVEPSTSRRRKD